MSLPIHSKNYEGYSCHHPARHLARRFTPSRYFLMIAARSSNSAAVRSPVIATFGSRLFCPVGTSAISVAVDDGLFTTVDMREGVNEAAGAGLHYIAGPSMDKCAISNHAAGERVRRTHLAVVARAVLARIASAGVWHMSAELQGPWSDGRRLTACSKTSVRSSPHRRLSVG